MMNDEKLEAFLKELYEEKIDEQPSAEDMGIDVEKLLNSAYREKAKKDRKKRRKKIFKQVSVAVVVFALVLTSIAIFSPEGYADLFRFMAQRESRGNESVMDNLIGEEQDEVTTTEIHDLSELDSILGIKLKYPKYLFENYMEYVANASESYGEVVSAHIEFCSPESRALIIYHIMPIEEKKASSYIFDVLENKVSLINKDGIEYSYYVDEESERSNIFWQDDEYFYYIEGDFDWDEAVEIVESME